ncbi:MAG TPA: hypothetical protein ENK67_08315, partial [Flavobacteriia bacterium]|nr:hypothetical protein [Flavobacteriia bacterium]
QDPNKLIFAPIDDAENNLQERTAQGVSAGVKEVIGVFLRYTEGAYAINHGNASIGLFTNLPEMLDKAILSRIQGRFKIDGSRTIPDFLDQDYIWWHNLDKMSPNFVNMENQDYKWLSKQKLAKNLNEILQNKDKPTEERVLKIFEQTEKKYQDTEHQFYAELYKGIQEKFPFFSSRDIRNIQKAVSMRLTDFDLPEDWLENPELFIRKDYQTKFTMLQDVMKQNMKGLDFKDIRKQEVIRYLDNMAIIADTDFKRKVDNRIKEMHIRLEAEKQFNK